MSKIEKIQKLIDRHGLTDASKISGLPRYELIRICDYPINHEIANTILWDLMYDNLIPKTYKNSTIYVSVDGVFYWTTKFVDGTNKVEITSMATPFWDGGKTTPVEGEWILITNIENDEKVHDQELYGEYFDELVSRVEFDGIEDLLTWFKHFYLPKVYNLILKQFEKFKESNGEDLFDSKNN